MTPYPAIEIYISNSNHTGFIEGNITNCNCSSIDCVNNFLFEGKINHKGIAFINIQSDLGSGGRKYNVGYAKIKYKINDDSLNCYYLSDHRDNPTLSQNQALPRFNTFVLTGC